MSFNFKKSEGLSVRFIGQNHDKPAIRSKVNKDQDNPRLKDINGSLQNAKRK